MTDTLRYKGEFAEYNEELLRLRRHFHQYPELALREEKTSAFIRKYMEELGYEITPVAPTGLIAQHPLLKKKEKMIVIRSEMDALPIKEQTGLPYASRNEGCMHACGHDAIMAAALVLAKIVASKGEAFPVGVRFLFEPAEEIGEGAKAMIAAGALENPAADGFVMFHFAGDGPFGLAVHEGQASAMIGGMQIHIHGKSSHWCQASEGIDGIYGASRVIQAIHDLNRDYVRRGPCLVGIGTVHGGEYPNIIADHVVLTGNIRACYEEDFQGLKSSLEKSFEKIEEETGTRIEMLFPKEPVLPFANDEGLTRIGESVGREIFGERFLLEGEEEMFLSGDNAYRYFQKTKGLFMVFLAGLEKENHPLHHPKFQIDEEILPYCVETLCRVVERMG